MWLITAVVAVGALTAKGQINAAKAQKIEFDMAAEQEKISAEGQELQRRQQLSKVLAANAVGQANSGISGEGTPSSIALASAKQASISEGIEGLSSRLKQAQLIRQGKHAKAAGRMAAASTLLSTTVSAATLSNKPQADPNAI